MCGVGEALLEALPNAIIKKYLQGCGISVDVHGRNDGKIYYMSLKPGLVAGDACEAIIAETASLLSGIVESNEESEDPFTGLDEKEELGIKILCKN